VFRVIILFVFGFLIHKFYHIVFPVGEFLGSSLKDLLPWFLNVGSFVMFLIIFMLCIFFVYRKLMHLGLIFAMIWSAVVSVCITLFYIPGYYKNKIMSDYGEWGDIYILVFTFILAVSTAYILTIIDNAFFKKGEK